MIKVQGYDGLGVDERNSAVINTNLSEYQKAIVQHGLKKAEVERLNNLEKKIQEQDEKLNLILEILTKR